MNTQRLIRMTQLFLAAGLFALSLPLSIIYSILPAKGSRKAQFYAFVAAHKRQLSNFAPSSFTLKWYTYEHLRCMVLFHCLCS